jgi:6-phosphofructokinase 1
MLATRMGVEAVNALLAGKTDVMVGLKGREIVLRSLEDVTTKSRPVNLDFYEIAEILSR